MLKLGEMNRVMVVVAASVLSLAGGVSGILVAEAEKWRRCRGIL